MQEQDTIWLRPAVEIRACCQVPVVHLLILHYICQMEATAVSYTHLDVYKRQVQERLNPDLKMEGVVFTMYDSRTNLSNEVVDNVKNNLHTTIYKTIIPRNVRLAEAPSHGLPINLYDSRSAGADSYSCLLYTSR